MLFVFCYVVCVLLSANRNLLWFALVVIVGLCSCVGLRVCMCLLYVLLLCCVASSLSTGSVCDFVVWFDWFNLVLFVSGVCVAWFVLYVVLC